MNKNFLNAQEMALKYPDTFYAPVQTELEAIEPGHFVKVEIAQERFWVLVQSMEGKKIKGLVNNDLLHTMDHGYKLNDPIELEHMHVIDILVQNEETERIAKNYVERMKASDPQWDLKQEFGQMLLRHISSFTKEELARYEELKTILKR